MRDWATSRDPVLLFEAIGGMGKSTVTWEWVNNHAAADRADWAGRLRYSFYERGADMRDFKVTTLAYMTRQPVELFRARPEAELTSGLLQQLGQAPWLVVLDGLERVLAAYHRSDAAQLRDEDVGARRHRPLRPQDCIRPDDHDLLLHLATAAPSKLLVSSRLMPRALLNASGDPVPGVRREYLHGLAPEDAEAMLRRAGINGDSERMRNYLKRAFDCHPLVVGFVAGLVRKSPWARMDFERWVNDTRGGGAVDLTDPDFRQRQTNILKLAFDVLEPRTRDLLARLGMLANAVDLTVLEALNPTLPEPPPQPGFWSDRTNPFDTKPFDESAVLEQIPEGSFREAIKEYYAAVKAWRQSDEVRDAPRWLSNALVDLEARGLLQWDHHNGTFDLHPVVRGYSVDSLNVDARGRAGQRVADYFSSRPKPNYHSAASSVDDLSNDLQVVRALNLAGKTWQAWSVLSTSLRAALRRLECHHELLALLRPLFPDGWNSPPRCISDPAVAANEAASALHHIGYIEESMAQEVYAIRGTWPTNSIRISLPGCEITS